LLAVSGKPGPARLSFYFIINSSAFPIRLWTTPGMEKAFTSDAEWTKVA